MQASPRVEQIPWWISPQPKTKVVPKLKKKVVRKKRASSFALFIVVAGLLALAVMVNVTERALIAQDAVGLESFKSELVIEQTLREDFLIQKTSLESPERIEAIAVEKLGMTKPEQVSYLVLPETSTAIAKSTQPEATDGNSSLKGTVREDMAALPPILGEIVQKIKITTLGDPEKDL